MYPIKNPNEDAIGRKIGYRGYHYVNSAYSISKHLS